MEELNESGLKLFFEDDIFLIDEKPLTVKEEDAPSSVLQEPEPESYTVQFKGENKKNIGIVITNESDDFLKESDETLLLNILKAIGLSIEDVAIINHHHSRTDWKDQIEVSKVVVFGVASNSYGMDTEFYTITKEQGAQWLFSHSLAELANDKTLKGQLWGKLQELFPG